MGMTGRRRLARLVMRAGIFLAAVTAIAAGASASHPLPQAHHALADDGVISSRN